MGRRKKNQGRVDPRIVDQTKKEKELNSDKSPIIPQRSKLKTDLTIFHRDLTPKQNAFVTLSQNKKSKLIFVSGPAGTSKSYISVYSSLLLLNSKRISDIIYVRSPVESAEKSIGLLPGEISDKLSPYMQPLLDKLEELLPKSDISFLKKDDRFAGIPIGFLRGLNWNAKAIILDEAQNCTFKELYTFITRIGEFSKVFVLGDPDQSDINGKSGFIKMMDIFDDDESKEHGIFTYRFDENDIVRSELVKFISKKISGK